MSDEYTPTTGEIREYVEVGGEPRPWEDLDDDRDAARADAFDRWLVAHDREVAANTLDVFAKETDAEYERVTAKSGAYGSTKYRAALVAASALATKRATAIREGRS